MTEQVLVQDYSKITQLTTVVIERASFLEFLSGRKFLWEFLWQVLPRTVKGEETSLHSRYGTHRIYSPLNFRFHCSWSSNKPNGNSGGPLSPKFLVSSVSSDNGFSRSWILSVSSTFGDV